MIIYPADPLRNYLAHKDEIDQAIHAVLEGGRYILGPQVTSFEEEFAAYLGTGSSVGVGSGTDALVLALRACDVGAGDLVITVSHTAVATVAAIEIVGAAPVLVDIEPDTYTIDIERLAATVNWLHEHGSTQGGKLKAIIPVHLYGNPAKMPAIMDIAQQYDLRVIEDCAQSHGASLQGKKTGSWGHISTFSFYPTKNLSALGDGGAVATSDQEIEHHARLLRQYGWQKRYISELPGMNSRLDELQAAVLRVKLRYLDQENEHRRQIARIYHECLAGTSLSLPKEQAEAVCVYHQYVVRSDHRDDLKSSLEQHEVGSLIHYPVPVHLQPAYANRVQIGAGGLQCTERVCTQVLSLPIHAQMELGQARRVGEWIARWDRRDLRET